EPMCASIHAAHSFRRSKAGHGPGTADTVRDVCAIVARVVRLTVATRSARLRPQQEDHFLRKGRRDPCLRHDVEMRCKFRKRFGHAAETQGVVLSAEDRGTRASPQLVETVFDSE